MKRSLWSIALIGACAGTFLAAHASDRSRAEVVPGRIPLADVRSRGIAGAGAPLGKIVSIRGTTVDGDTLGDKGSMGKTFLRVDRVDGRKLRDAVLIEVGFHPFEKDDLRKPAHGEAIGLTGWETGGYAGAVEGEFDHVQPYATTAYRFETDFVAVKISK